MISSEFAYLFNMLSYANPSARMGATREEIAAELLKASKAVKAAEVTYQGIERTEKVRLLLSRDPSTRMLICR